MERRRRWEAWLDGLLSTLLGVEVPWAYNPHLDLGCRKPWLYSFNFSEFVVNFCQQTASLRCSSISIFCRLAWPSWWLEFRPFSSSKETQVSGINDSTCMEDSKDHHSASHQEDESKRSAHCIAVSESPRETQHSQVLDRPTMSLTQRREGARWSLTGYWSLLARASPAEADSRQSAYTRPSPTTSEEP